MRVSGVQTSNTETSGLEKIAAWYVEVANPILKAASEALEGMVRLSVERGKPSFRVSAYTEEDITVAISIEGSLKGVILLSFNYRTAFRMLQKLLGKELNTNLPISNFLLESELARSALQEIANVLAGRSAMHFEKAGKICVISQPELFMRRGVLISERDFRQLVIPLKTEAGELNLSIALSPTEGHEDAVKKVFVAQHVIQPRKSVVRHDFSNPEHLGRTVYSVLQQVHERYQQILGQQLSVRLRVSLNLSPARLEKDTFLHFLQRDYQWSVAAAFATNLSGGVWILAISKSLASVLIDRWLGGPGKVALLKDEWTPLERAALTHILNALSSAYSDSWAQQGFTRPLLQLSQVFIGDLNDQIVAFRTGGGALLISHGLQVGEETGILQWLLPAESSSALISNPTRIISKSSAINSPLSPSVRLKLRFGWQGFPITMRQLGNLQVGTILPLKSNLLIWCEGRVIGTGEPYRRNSRLVAKIVQWRGGSLLLPHPDNELDKGTEGSKG